MQYWTCSPVTLVEQDVQRILISEKTKNHTDTYCKFRYPHVDILYGEDHGAGVFRSAIKVNLISPEEKRLKYHGHAEEALLVSNAQCKKDAYKILRELHRDINNDLNTLQNSQLVSILVDTELILCKLLPSEAVNPRVKDIGGIPNIEYQHAEATIHIPLENMNLPETIQEDRIEVIYTITLFQLFVTGDLAFYASLCGQLCAERRYCHLCLSSTSDWCPHDNRDNDYPKVTFPLLESICNSEDDTKFGVTHKPILTLIDPSNFICPLLHIEMGLVNKYLDSMVSRLDIDIDISNENEAECLDQYRRLNEELSGITSELTRLLQSYNHKVSERRKDICELDAELLSLGQNPVSNHNTISQL